MLKGAGFTGQLSKGELLVKYRQHEAKQALYSSCDWLFDIFADGSLPRASCLDCDDYDEALVMQRPSSRPDQFVLFLGECLLCSMAYGIVGRPE